MEDKMKVGDKVIVTMVDLHDSFNIGDIGDLIAIDGNLAKVAFPCIKAWAEITQIELYTETEKTMDVKQAVQMMLNGEKMTTAEDHNGEVWHCKFDLEHPDGPWVYVSNTYGTESKMGQIWEVLKWKKYEEPKPEVVEETKEYQWVYLYHGSNEKRLTYGFYKTKQDAAAVVGPNCTILHRAEWTEI